MPSQRASADTGNDRSGYRIKKIHPGEMQASRWPAPACSTGPIVLAHFISHTQHQVRRLVRKYVGEARGGIRKGVKAWCCFPRYPSPATCPDRTLLPAGMRVMRDRFCLLFDQKNTA